MAGWQVKLRSKSCNRWLDDKSQIDVKVRKQMAGWQEWNWCQGQVTAGWLTTVKLMSRLGNNGWFVDKSNWCQGQVTDGSLARWQLYWPIQEHKYSSLVWLWKYPVLNVFCKTYWVVIPCRLSGYWIINNGRRKKKQICPSHEQVIKISHIYLSGWSLTKMFSSLYYSIQTLFLYHYMNSRHSKDQ